MKTVQGFFRSAPLWRLCVAWSRWNHRFLTSPRPWKQMVRSGLTADEARAGWDTAATSLVPMLHGWLFTMAFIVGWDLAFEAVWTLWRNRWVFYLNAVPIALAIPVLVIVLCRVAGRRTAPERLLGRVQAAVSALRPPIIPRRRRRPGQPGRWFALSRLRARQRRRLKTLAWQIDGDLALLAGYPAGIGILVAASARCLCGPRMVSTRPTGRSWLSACAMTWCATSYPDSPGQFRSMVGTLRGNHRSSGGSSIS